MKKQHPPPLDPGMASPINFSLGFFRFKGSRMRRLLSKRGSSSVLAVIRASSVVKASPCRPEVGPLLHRQCPLVLGRTRVVFAEPVFIVV